MGAKPELVSWTNLSEKPRPSLCYRLPNPFILQAKKKKLCSIYLPHVPTPISTMSLVMVTPTTIILDDNTNLIDITGYITYPTNLEATQDKLCLNLFNS
jgi:hypothetical protein